MWGVLPRQGICTEMAYRTDTWSVTIPIPVPPVPPPPVPVSRTSPDQSIRLLEAIDTPFRFLVNGDIETTFDERVLENNIKLSVMLTKKNVPLKTNLGSQVMSIAFGSLDEVTGELVKSDIQDAVAAGEPRVYLSSVPKIIESNDNTISAVFSYKAKQKNIDKKYINMEVWKFLDKGN